MSLGEMIIIVMAASKQCLDNGKSIYATDNFDFLGMARV